MGVEELSLASTPRPTPLTCRIPILGGLFSRLTSTTPAPGLAESPFASSQRRIHHLIAGPLSPPPETDSRQISPVDLSPSKMPCFMQCITHKHACAALPAPNHYKYLLVTSSSDASCPPCRIMRTLNRPPSATSTATVVTGLMASQSGPPARQLVMALTRRLLSLRRRHRVPATRHAISSMLVNLAPCRRFIAPAANSNSSPRPLGICALAPSASLLFAVCWAATASKNIPQANSSRQWRPVLSAPGVAAVLLEHREGNVSLSCTSSMQACNLGHCYPARLYQ